MPRALLAAVFGFLFLIAPAVAADRWATYTNAEYGFSVELPGTVTVDSRPTGNSDFTNARFYGDDGTGFYGVSVIRLPSNYTFNLDKGVAGEVAIHKGVIVSQEVVSVQGFPARKVKFVATEDGEKVTRWLLCIQTPKGAFTVLTAQFDPENQHEVDRVLNSFKLL